MTLLIATGTHRPNTDAELDAMLGRDVRRACRVVNHRSTDRASLIDLGSWKDVPVLLNREWVEADLRITTGFVEPHFFAGFSGGPKMVAPGLAGMDTVLALHNATRIGDPRATWGVCEGNPVHDAVRAVAAFAPPQFAAGRPPQPRATDHSGVRRRALGDAPRGARPCASRGDGPRPGAVRRRADHEQRLSAGPEPLPVGEGHVGRRGGRPAGRRDRVRRRVPRRAARSWGLRRDPRRGQLAGRAARGNRRVAGHPTGSMAGADPGTDPAATPACLSMRLG